ncbi:MAG: flagellar protein FlgN [Spirochaetes bacterium]|nr:MAG: flagellar protein FlgN [Spirochaetota bacterium]
MANPVNALEKVLNEEITLYTSLCALEERKSEAIIAKDGKELEEASGAQEALLVLVAGLEERRLKLIDEYAENNHLDDMPRRITLRDIVFLMDEDSSRRLMRLGMDLKKLLLRLQSLHATNSTLIEDNLKFFNTLLSGIRSSMTIETGYSRQGVEKARIADSLLVNRTV